MSTVESVPFIFHVVETEVAHAEKKAYCKGRACEKCGLCRDWNFTGALKTWSWIRQSMQWCDKDWDRWNKECPWKQLERAHGATCTADAQHPNPSLLGYSDYDPRHRFYLDFDNDVHKPADYPSVIIRVTFIMMIFIPMIMFITFRFACAMKRETRNKLPGRSPRPCTRENFFHTKPATVVRNSSSLRYRLILLEIKKIRSVLILHRRTVRCQ